MIYNLYLLSILAQCVIAAPSKIKLLTC